MSDVEARAPARHDKTFERCPFCDGPIAEKYAGLKDRLQTTSQRFAISECGVCGAALLNPAPVGDVSQFYPTNYLSAETPSATEAGGLDLEKWYRYNQYDFDFGLLERATGRDIGRTGSYVDLGCGSGERVTYAGERGCGRAVGVDKFDFAKSRAKLEADLINSDILAFAPEERFQTASLFHVLEHLENPGEVLAHVGDAILQPGGHLMVQVPNYGSLESHWLKGRWFGLDVPRHYWHFTEQAICRLLAAHGYRVDAVYQRNAPLHPVSIVPSLFPQVDVQRIWVDGTRGEGYKLAMKILWAGLTVLSIPVCMLQNLLGRSSMLSVVASRG